MGMNHSMKTFVVLIAIVTSLYAERPFATQTVLMVFDDAEPMMSKGQCEWDPDIEVNVATCFHKMIHTTTDESLKIGNYVYTRFMQFDVDVPKRSPGIINETLQHPAVTNEKDRQNLEECLKKINYSIRLTKKYGAMFSYLYAALCEEQSIIIATSSIVHYVMQYLETVSKNPFGVSNSMKIDPKKWIAKKVTAYLYVFVPVDYFFNAYNRSPLKKIYQDNKKYSLDELVVGLKLKDKERIKDEDFMKPETYLSKGFYPEAQREIEEVGGGIGTTQWHVSWISKHIITYLNDIFISEKEYRTIFSDRSEEELHEIMPARAIILAGHGLPYVSLKERIQSVKSSWGVLGTEEIKRLEELLNKGEIIHRAGMLAGLNADDFGKFVDCLSKIGTTFFFFNTCFGSPEQVNKALNILAQEKEYNLAQLSFSFPIVSGAVSESTTATIVSKTGFSLLKIPVFKNFFDILTAQAQPLSVQHNNEVTFIVKKSPTEQTIANALSAIYKIDPFLNNVPVIKNKDLPWRLLTIPETTAVIDATLARLYTQGVLNLAQFFNTKKLDIVVFNTLHIPFTLNFASLNTFPALIPLLPGDGIYDIKSLEAQDFNLTEVAALIMPMESLTEYKICIFKALHVRNDVVFLDKDLFDESIILTHVFVYNGPQGKGIYFVYKGDYWHANLSEKDFENFIASLPREKQKDGSVRIIFKDMDGKVSNLTAYEINQILNNSDHEKFRMTLTKKSSDDFQKFLDTIPQDIKTAASSDSTFEKLMNVSLQKKMEDIKKGNIRYHTSTVDTFARALQTL